MERGWERLAVQMIKSCLEGEEQHSAMVVEQDEGGESVGTSIRLLTPKQRRDSTTHLHQPLVH